MVKMEKATIAISYRRLLDDVRAGKPTVEGEVEEDPGQETRKIVNPLFLHILKNHIYLAPNESIYWSKSGSDSGFIEVTDEVAEKLHQLAGPYKLVVFKVLNEQLLENLTGGHRNGDQSVNDR